jgi:hypothetical protein
MEWKKKILLMSICTCMILTALPPPKPALIPVAYGTQGDRGLEITAVCDMPQTAIGLYGLFTGKITFEQFLIKADIIGSISSTKGPNFLDPSVHFAAQYSLTNALKTVGPLIPKFLGGIALTATYTGTVNTPLGPINFITGVEYNPSKNKASITSSIQTTIQAHTLSMRLVNVDLSKGQFGYSLFPEAQKILNELGTHTLGDPKNPAKPDTFKGSTSGSSSSSEPFERDNLNGFGLTSCTINDTDPTQLVCSADLNLTTPEAVGGVAVSIDKFGLFAPYIGLASTMMIGAVAAAVYVKRVKRREEKQ